MPKPRKFKLQSRTAERRLRRFIRKRLRRLRKSIEKRARAEFASRQKELREDAEGYDPASIRRMWVRIAGDPVPEAESVAKTVHRSVDRTLAGAVREVVSNPRPLPAKMDLAEEAAQIAGKIRSLEDDYIGRVGAKLEKIAAREATESELTKMLQERAGMASRKAELLARDQVGALEAKVAQERAQEAGVPRYIWRTQNDERVREEHDAREGQSFEWDKPPSDGHPGEPPNCRCWAEPDIDSVLEEM